MQDAGRERLNLQMAKSEINSNLTPELSRAERTASHMNFRKLHESEAVEASRSNDSLDCADDVQTGCKIRLNFSLDK